MTVHARAERRDANEAGIVDAMRQVGDQVRRLSQPGLPDLLVLYRRRVSLMEVKGRLGRATMAQERFKLEGWPVDLVQTPFDALKAIGAIPCG